MHPSEIRFWHPATSPQHTRTMATALIELQPGDRVDHTLGLVQCHLRKTPDGRPFLLGEVRDRSRALGFVCWRADEGDRAALTATGYVHICGRTERYRDRLQVVADSITAATVTPADAQVLSAGPSAAESTALEGELDAIIERLGEPLRSLVQQVLRSDESVRSAFAHAPAAIAMHHPWPGGLLAHSVAVGHLAEDVAKRYPELDRDLLVAGALLHDHAKIDELSWDQGLDYTTAGNLVGHIAIGCQRVTDAARSLPDFPQRLLEKILHIILSHHGELAYGSPKEPVLAEAIAVHLIDTLDSRLEAFSRAVREHAGPGEWTAVAKPFGRRLYCGD